MNASLFSSVSVDWATPQWLFDALNERFAFTFDPCATAENAKCRRFFTLEDNGLEQAWLYERVFMNPPYGRDIVQWVNKARFSAVNGGSLVVGLLPARTDARWWQEHVQGHADVRFIAGRLKFGNATSAAPFPSALAIWWGWPVLAGGFAHE